MIKKILVATDASAASNRAVSMAAYMAACHDAELLILHVIRDMQLPTLVKKAPELEEVVNPYCYNYYTDLGTQALPEE